MYLGFFFVHWSSTNTSEVARYPPIPLNPCPFCKQASDAVIKIYNTKTKHYSSFSLGKGDFQATFTCRNCTTEGRLPRDIELTYINMYLIREKLNNIMARYPTKPDKAIRDLEKLIRKSGENPTTYEMRTMLDEWKRERIMKG